MRFNDSETFVFFKSLFRYFVIKDIITLRSYIFERNYTYQTIENEIRQNENNAISD